MSPADESKPVKVRKTPAKYKKASPDDKRLKANKQRSEAQVAAQFKPGNEAGKQTKKVNNAKRNRRLRDQFFTMIDQVGIPLLVDKLYDEDLETKHLIDIMKLLLLYGVGKPAEMEVEDNAQPDHTIINNIVISQEAILAAQQNDTDHLHIIDN